MWSKIILTAERNRKGKKVQALDAGDDNAWITVLALARRNPNSRRNQNLPASAFIINFLYLLLAR